MKKDEIQPHIYNEIGYCPEDFSCPSYDGKRCKLLGHQPDHICEPWIRILIETNHKLKVSHDYDGA
jgi:hypothetical protein